MKKSDDIHRLKKLLFADSMNISDETFELLKADLTKLLQSYFELTEDSVILTVEPNPDGNFLVSITANASHIKELKILN